jgi:hypothetical protein
MKITIAGFAGANKALHTKLLPDAVGVDSFNQKPGRGDLRPWKTTVGVQGVPTGRQTIYRMGRNLNLETDFWLSWTGVVHAVRGYSSGDTVEKTYFTGDGEPKWTNFTLALASTPYPVGTRHLGVPAPTAAPTVSVLTAGTSVNTENLYYVYTFVTDQNEESAPSPVSTVISVKTDGTQTISAIQAAPAGSFTINRVRIYRTQTGELGDTDFFFLREIAAGVASTTDDRRVLGEGLETSEWVEPPATLTNLTAMWNGMLAGINGVGVRFCEPFAPYAWPARYEILPPDAQPIALGRWQQNLLVLTTAKPLLVVGTSPDSLDQQPLDIGEACVASRGVVSFGHGVVWPCPDGLVYYGDGGAKMLTAGLLTRDDWQALNPTTLIGAAYEGMYFGVYTDAGSVKRGFLIDPIDPKGIFFLDTGYDALYFDEFHDKLYVYNASTGFVSKWDGGATPMTTTFRSKTFVTEPTCMSAMRVVADAYPVTVKLDAGPFTSSQATALAAASGGNLTSTGTAVRFTKSVTSEFPVRLPSGFKATDWQIQVESTGAVQAVHVASAMEELS